MAILGLFALLGFLVCLVMLSIKAIKKQPKKKTLITLAACFVVFVVALSIPSGDTKATAPIETTKVTISFEIKAGEAGDYGKELTFNKDTEFEENYFVYYIPAGTYTVTNVGEYQTQLSVCSTEIEVTKDGWEEPAEVYDTLLLDVQQSGELTISKNQYIETHEPGLLKFETSDLPPSKEQIEETTTAPTAAPTAAPMPSVSMGEKNALKSAKAYLDYTAFSYTGLIEQLEYEKYSHEEAVYAADNCGADWNEQAAKAAKIYLDYTSFSRDGLIDQLIYEGYSEEQAIYGVEKNGF